MSKIWIFIGGVSVLLYIIEIFSLLLGIVSLVGILVYPSVPIAWILSGCLWAVWLLSRKINPWLNKKLEHYDN
jgi:ABC-type multidrug transport system permease subunit